MLILSNNGMELGLYPHHLLLLIGPILMFLTLVFIAPINNLPNITLPMTIDYLLPLLSFADITHRWNGAGHSPRPQGHPVTRNYPTSHPAAEFHRIKGGTGSGGSLSGPPFKENDKTCERQTHNISWCNFWDYIFGQGLILGWPG